MTFKIIEEIADQCERSALMKLEEKLNPVLDDLREEEQWLVCDRGQMDEAWDSWEAATLLAAFLKKIHEDAWSLTRRIDRSKNMSDIDDGIQMPLQQ